MLGNFPTWFQIRERGKQYTLAVRAQVHQPLVWGGSYDAQELKSLTPIHHLLADRCLSNQLQISTPEYDWYLDTGARYNYFIYPIPFPWRHPFLKWINELVGPEGTKPNLPHNIPEPVDPYLWTRTYDFNDMTFGRMPTRPRTARQAAAVQPVVWNDFNDDGVVGWNRG